jgi:hypothetical protein
MRFTKAVISSGFVPLGFLYIEGGKEYYADYSSLCRRNASDGRLIFDASGVFGLYTYGENDIEVCRETEGGGYSDPIDPGITLTRRLISGGDVVGYTVRDGTGTEVNKRIESILSAAKYLKPVNFKVVTRGGRQILQGKGGTVLGDLPAINLTPEIAAVSKPVKARTAPHGIVDPRRAGGVSLLRLFEIIDDNGGSALKLPDDEYKAVGETYTTDHDGFIRVRACEIARPVLYASSKKMSASLKYRRPGAVMVNGMMILAYVHRDKNIVNIHYENGVLRGDKVRLGRVGVAIPKDRAQAFYSDIAGTVAVSPMSDRGAAQSAVQLAEIADPELLEIEVGEMPILSGDYSGYLLDGESIRNILLNIYKYKYAAKVFSATAASVKDTIYLSAKPRVWRHYERYNPDVIDALAQLVDISTGIYKGSGAEITNRSAVPKDANVEISYELIGDYTIPKASDLCNIDASALPSEVGELVGTVLESDDGDSKLRLCTEGAASAKVVVARFEMQLFKHKVAMLLDGNNLAHKHDATEWGLPSKAPGSRAQFTKYEHGAGVSVILRNISKAS